MASPEHVASCTYSDGVSDFGSCCPDQEKSAHQGWNRIKTATFSEVFLQRKERGEDVRIGSFAYFAGNGSCPEANLSVSPLFRKRKPNSRIPFSISLNKQSYPNMISQNYSISILLSCKCNVAIASRLQGDGSTLLSERVIPNPAKYKQKKQKIESM